MTSGISELEDFPVIGPTLNETVGQLIKPRRYMHTDELPLPYGTATAEGIVRDLNEYEKARAQDKQAYVKIMPSGDMQPVEWQPAPGTRSERTPTMAQLYQHVPYLCLGSGRAGGRRDSDITQERSGAGKC